jgi:hypothetical protein
MNIGMLLFIAVLFFVLTPGILVSLPSTTSDKYTVALLHAVIFALIYHFTHKPIKKLTEGFTHLDSKIQCENECTSNYNTCMFNCTAV